MNRQFKTLNTTIFILDPNKETSDYATLRRTAIKKHWAMGHQIKNWLSLKQTVVEMLSSNTGFKKYY
jgi:hypothetical protein